MLQKRKSNRLIPFGLSKELSQVFLLSRPLKSIRLFQEKVAIVYPFQRKVGFSPQSILDKKPKRIGKNDKLQKQ